MSLPVQDYQILSESDLLNLSQDQLESYFKQTSSILETEKSTIQGLNTEEGYFRGLVDLGGSTITGLDTEIRYLSLSLSQLQTELNEKVEFSTLLESQIVSTVKAIEYHTDVYSTTTSTLEGYGLEENRLQTIIAEIDAKFTTDALAYSSMIYTYVSKRNIYESLKHQLSTTSTLFESSVLGYAVEYERWQQSYSTLTEYEGQMSNLQKEEIQALGESNLARLRLEQANQDLYSTITSYNYLSSLVKLAELNETYAVRMSSVYDKSEHASKVRVLYEEWDEQFKATYGSQIQKGGATTIDISAPNSAEAAALSFEDMKQFRDKAYEMYQTALQDRNAEQAAVDALERTVNDTGIAAYQSLLSNYDDEIELSLSSFYNYKKIRETLEQEEIPRLVAERDSNLANAGSYYQQSTFWGEAYLSTLDGVVEMRQEETRQKSSYDSHISYMRRLEEEIKFLEREETDTLSSFVGLSTFSTIANQELATLDAQIAAYTSSYTSIGSAIFQYSDRIKTYTDELTRLGNRSTIELLTIQRLDQDYSRYITTANYSALQQEKSAYEYRETYVRQLRITKQNAYEDAIKLELQRAKSLADQMGSDDINQYVRMDTPEIQGPYTDFMNLTTYLESFPKLYDRYNAQMSNFQGLLKEFEYYTNLQSELTTVSAGYANFTNQAQYKQSMDDIRARIAQKETEIAGYTKVLETGSNAIRPVRDQIWTTYLTFFPTASRDPIERSISSILTASFIAGKIEEQNLTQTRLA
jgi:hypothetical protein